MKYSFLVICPFFLKKKKVKKKVRGPSITAKTVGNTENQRERYLFFWVGSHLWNHTSPVQGDCRCQIRHFGVGSSGPESCAVSSCTEGKRREKLYTSDTQREQVQLYLVCYLSGEQCKGKDLGTSFLLLGIHTKKTFKSNIQEVTKSYA